MLERTMVGGAPGANPGAGGDQTGGAPGDQTGGAAGGEQGAGDGGGAELSTQQMVDSLAKVMGVEAEGITEEQEFRVRQEARNLITDVQSAIGDELPDATRSQVNALVDGIVNTDPVKIINAVRDALKVAEEKQSNSMKQSAGALNIQGTGNGKGGAQEAPKSMGEASILASRLFGA